jgi:hypothetical protein
MKLVKEFSLTYLSFSLAVCSGSSFCFKNPAQSFPEIIRMQYQAEWS